jgi:hypothetical protein
MAKARSGKGGKPMPLRVVCDHELDEADWTIEKIDRRTDELFADLRRFMVAVRRAEPDCDDRRAFESWAVHQVAKLQVLFEWLNERAKADALGKLILGTTGKPADPPDKPSGS